MYLADSARGHVLRHDVDPTGRLGPSTVFTQIADGQPDGMTVDQDGCLWVAIWGAGQVRRYDANANLQQTVILPVPQPTAPCLGGPDGRRLFVTTASHHLGADVVGLSGGVFSTPVTSPGSAATSWGPVPPAQPHAKERP